jgi:thiosulfate/3-mercaptopyruvate sulfurtransferase
MHRHFIALSLLFWGMAAQGQEALVDASWLHQNLSETGLYVLDIQNADRYRRFHIPGAVNAPYAQWRSNDRSPIPGRLPSAAYLEKWIGQLGISNDSHIVIVATGDRAEDMAAASRVFWTLKMIGQERLSILNGGLAAYARLYGIMPETTPRNRIPEHYHARPGPAIRADVTTVLKALHSDSQLLDARTLGEYMGVITLGPGERPGTLPGAIHLPFNWLVDETGRIREKSQIIALFKAVGADPTLDGTIHFCHSGNRAALNWFVDYAILGNRKAKLYDASMREWSARNELPMDTKITLPPAK